MSQICPYPGPRSFNEDESILFKGRDQYLDEIGRKLADNHFLLVTGASGDGKSSLIFAGLFPFLKAGFIKAKFSSWIIADFRPKRDPFENLAISLASSLGYDDIEGVKQNMKVGYSAILDLYRRSAKSSNLIILADQFEEFFTNEENYNFESGTAKADARLVVQILIETVRIAQKDNLPVYVICTMRSDYFGHCTAFSGFPNLIVKSQFYLERLNRNEILEAIREPAILSGNKISERLLQVLMNEITDDIGVDMLPILQHCLYQIWKCANNGKEEMDLVHYTMVGGYSRELLSIEDQSKFQIWFDTLPENFKIYYKKPCLRNVLDIHANRLYDTAHEYITSTNENIRISKEEAQRIIKVGFKCLTRVDDRRAVRNLMTLQEITDMLGDSKIDITKVSCVLDIYRTDGNSFLRPFITKATITQHLEPGTILDISHEALMRNWNKLEAWAWEEYESVITYRELCAQLNKWLKNNKAKSNLLSAGNLIYFERWYKEQDAEPVAWLKRYMEVDDKALSESEKHALSEAERKEIAKQHLEEIKEYLALSRATINRKQRMARMVTGVIAVLLVFAVGAWIRSEKLASEIERTARANAIATKASRSLSTDPTLSFRLAEEAYKIQPTNLSKEVIMSAYAQLPYYNLLKGHTKTVSFARFTPDNKYIITHDNKIRFWDYKGKQIKTWDLFLNVYMNDGVFNFSRDGKKMLVVRKGSSAVLLDQNNNILITFNGHTQETNSAFFSSDEQYVITASDDSTAKLWTINGQEILTLKGHTDKVKLAIMSPDNKFIVTFSLDQKAKFWSMQGQIIHELNDIRIAMFPNANFSADGSYVTFTSSDAVGRLWNVKDKKVILLKGHSDQIWSSYFSPDGKHVLTSSIDNTARLWDLNGTQVCIFSGHTAKLWKAIFSHDGSMVATISDDCTARIWNLSGKTLYILKGHTSQLFDICFSLDDQYVVTGSYDWTARLWNIKPKENTMLNLHFSWVDDAIFSKDGKYIATAGYDYSLRLWDNKGYHVKQFKGHTQYGVYSVNFTNDGNHLLSTGRDQTIRLWDLKGNQKQIFNTNSYFVIMTDFSYDNNYFISKSYLINNTNGQLWNMNGMCVKSFNNPNNICLHPQKNILAESAIDSTINIYDIMSFNNKDSLKLMTTIKCAIVPDFVSFSLDGSYIITIMSDYSVCIWQYSDKKITLLNTMKQHTEPIKHITFSSDNRYFVTTSADKLAILWNMDGTVKVILSGHTNIVTYADFSPDSKYIITSSNDFTVRLWDLDGNELQVYPGHSATVVKATFSPDGKYILSASNDQTARLIPWQVEDVIHKINVEKVRGDVWQMSDEDKKLYGIK